MKKILTKCVAVLVLAAVSFGSCFGSQRRRRRFDNRQSTHTQRGSSLHNAIRQDIFAVHRMLKGVSRRKISHSDLGLLLDDFKVDMLDAYIVVKGGRPSSKEYGKYSKQEQKKYIVPFDQNYVKLYAQVVDDRLERMLEQKDSDLDRAINLVISRHVAVQAGARNLPMVQDAITNELKNHGIHVRGGARRNRFDAYDEYGGYKEESTLMKAVKVVLGIGAVGAVLTGGAYGVYRFGVDKENKKTKGFWNWLLPKNGTKVFNLGDAQELTPEQ